MVILYKTNKLEKIFSEESIMKAKYGEECTKKIVKILDRLKAFETLGEYNKSPFGKMDRLQGNRKGEYALDLKHPYRLIIEPCK